MIWSLKRREEAEKRAEKEGKGKEEKKRENCIQELNLSMNVL
jgi:hypothetical protein